MSIQLKKRHQDYLSAWLLCVPALAFIAIFRFWPLIEVFRVSFFDYSLISQSVHFIGLDNFKRALSDPFFYRALESTVIFTVGIVPLKMGLALALAIFVQRGAAWIGIVRSAIFMPVVTAMVIASVLWTMMYHPSLGLFNSILSSLGLSRLPFLTRPELAVPSIIVFVLWKDAGYSMIFFLAGLQAIPEIYYEALAIDGGGRFAAFRYVTVPLLRRTTLFVFIISTIESFRIFTPMYVMTQGGPSFSTRTIVYYIYQLGFVNNEMGYASAVSVILLILILLLSVGQLRLGRSDD